MYDYIVPKNGKEKKMFKIFKAGVKKILSLKGSPYAIAAGVACGVTVSFTPFVGAHMILAAFSAWMIGGSIMGSAVGTLAGNPWTFPIIWPMVWETGRHMLGGKYPHSGEINFDTIFHQTTAALKNLDFSLFFSDIWPIIFPMIVGCVPFCATVWLLSYWSLYHYLRKKRQEQRKK